MKLKNTLVATMVVFSMLSCVTSKSASSGWSYASEGGFERTYQYDGVVARHEDNKRVTNIERKVLYSAFLSLSVDNPDTVNSNIEKIVKTYDGYINQIGTERTIIRVKSAHLKAALDEVSKLGKVLNRSMKGQDVTEKYTDHQIRLDNAEKARQRYLELLAKAENVEAALKVEKELERLNRDIDVLKGKLNHIDHLSEFSTITIQIRERKKPGILGYVGLGFYHSIKWLFVRN